MIASSSTVSMTLNMPRKDGHEVLQEVISDPLLQQIPIVVLTTSQADQDIMRSYNLGANTFISKPATLDSLVHMVQGLSEDFHLVSDQPPIH